MTEETKVAEGEVEALMMPTGRRVSLECLPPFALDCVLSFLGETAAAIAPLMCTSKHLQEDVAYLPAVCAELSPRRKYPDSLVAFLKRFKALSLLRVRFASGTRGTATAGITESLDDLIGRHTTSLVSLAVMNCDVGSPALHLPKLQALEFSTCRYFSPPRDLSLPRLSKLDLSRTGVSDFDVGQLLSKLAPTLEILRLQGCKNLRHEMTVESGVVLSKLKAIDVTDSHMNGHFVKQLLDLSPNLKVLTAKFCRNLENPRFEHPNLEELQCWGSHRLTFPHFTLPKLKTLSMGRTRMCNDALVELLLENGCPAITSLNLAECGKLALLTAIDLPPVPTSDMGEPLAPRVLENVTDLNLSHTKLGMGVYRQIVGLCGDNLQTLALNSCPISASFGDGVLASLKSLSLMHADTVPSVARDIAAGCPVLEEYTGDYCQLAGPNYRTITILDRCNTEEAAQILKDCPNVTELHFRFTRDDLVELVVESDKLEILDLVDCRQLRVLHLKTPRLRHLDLTRCLHLVDAKFDVPALKTAVQLYAHTIAVDALPAHLRAPTPTFTDRRAPNMPAGRGRRREPPTSPASATGGGGGGGGGGDAGAGSGAGAGSSSGAGAGREGGDDTAGSQVDRSPLMRSSELPSTATSRTSIELEVINARIERLEKTLDDPMLSAVSRHGLKRQLAIAKAMRIREQRRLAAAPAPAVTEEPEPTPVSVSVSASEPVPVPESASEPVSPPTLSTPPPSP